MTTGRHALTAAALCLALLGPGLAGCREETGLRFSHALHAGEAGCPDCHRGDDLRTGMDPCRECHEIDLDNPSEECLMCHTRPGEEGYAVSPAARGPSYADVIFDHSAHEDVDCVTCHRGMDGAEALTDVRFPVMDTCLECHDGDEAPAGCPTCHETLRRDRRPPTHDGLWARRHGRRPDLSPRTCSYCHPGRDPCRTCHQERKPRSHTLGWKTRSHGLEARHDRDACRACHSASFCSDCHQEAPRSHFPRNGWLASGHRIQGAASADSCRVCHTATEGTCLACHPRGF